VVQFLGMNKKTLVNPRFFSETLDGKSGSFMLIFCGFLMTVI